MNEADRALAALRAAREEQYAAWMTMKMEELRAEVARKRIADLVRDGFDPQRSPQRNQPAIHQRRAGNAGLRLRRAASKVKEAELIYGDIISRKPPHGKG